MTQTIDSSTGVYKMKPQTWADVARVHGVDPKTIERDRIALNRFEEPISEDLLEDIRRMRRWCELGKGGGPFSRRKFIKHKLAGTLEEKLKQLEIL
jgi:hypothetical protein